MLARAAIVAMLALLIALPVRAEADRQEEAPSSPASESAPPASAAETDPQVLWGMVTLSVGLAALAAGAVVGVVAVVEHGKLDCPDDQCGPDQHEAARDLNALRTASTVPSLVGGLLCFAGVAIVVSHHLEQPSLAIRLGPGMLSVDGRF